MAPSSLGSAHGRELRVLAIGGGTGLATLLRGLKKYTAALSRSEPAGGSPFDSAPDGSAPRKADSARISELCAVVTVSDDGGSSGRLRQEFNMLPPGGVRNCIVALSEEDAMLSELLQHPLQKEPGLA